MTTRLQTRACLLAPSWLLLVACPGPVTGAQEGAEDEVGTSDGRETADTGGTTTGTETSETETSETGPEPCEGPEDCESAEAPFCDDLSGECVGCEGVMDPDGACAELDAGVPLCVENACVQCTGEQDAACVDLTPICDVETNTCIGCSGHEECPASACNIAEGNCFDPASVVHVDGDNPCGAGDGSDESPYCSLSEALLDASEDPVLIVHEVVGDPLVYLESNTISISAAIFAAPGESPVVRGSVSSALTVSSSGHLYVSGISIDSTAGGSVGILIQGGQTWIEKSRIVNNSGGGIVVDGGGSLVLENSFVGGNTTDVDALVVTDGSATVIYSTLAGGAAASNALSCEAGATVDIRNSLLVSRQSEDEVVCDEAILSNNALEMDVAENTSLGEMPDTSWFVSYMSGDFSLSGAHPEAIEMAATWLDGDPATDIEGDARPTTDGMPDFAGADRIP